MVHKIASIICQIFQHATRDHWHAAIGWPTYLKLNQFGFNLPRLLLSRTVKCKRVTCCKKWHAPAAHWNVHECYWPWVQEVARACRTLKCTRVLLTMNARSGTRLPHNEMYTSVTGHGFKKWHAPVPRWNEHTAACWHLARSKWAGAQLITFVRRSHNLQKSLR